MHLGSQFLHHILDRDSALLFRSDESFLSSELGNSVLHDDQRRDAPRIQYGDAFGNVEVQSHAQADFLRLLHCGWSGRAVHLAQ